jgi:hypothetical protein
MKMKEHFKVPEEFKIFAIISVGVPVKIPNPRPRIPLHELTYKEEYGPPYYPGPCEEVKL